MRSDKLFLAVLGQWATTIPILPSLPFPGVARHLTLTWVLSILWILGQEAGTMYLDFVS